MRKLTTNCGATVLVDDEVADTLGGRGVSLGSHGYAQIWDGAVLLLHRWIMGVKRGEGYRRIVDHINGDKLDNRRANLRIVSASDSNYNRNVRGRCYYPGRHGGFYVRIGHMGEVHHLGTYETEEEAAEVVRAFREENGIKHLRFQDEAA